MEKNKFNSLIARGILNETELAGIIREAEDSGQYPEELLLKRGVQKHEILFCLSEYYGCPFIEFDENVLTPIFLTRRLAIEKLKHLLWFPLSVAGNRTEVIAYDPYDPSVIEDVKKTLSVKDIDFTVSLPSDLLRIIENNYDVNPNFPSSAGRTPFAKVRTFLADRRSVLACYRTSLARGRTGLAFLRTGVSFITIALLLLRIFGAGYMTVFEALLFIAGIVITIDGLIWYLPGRKTGKKLLNCSFTESTGGTTVLEVLNTDNPVFSRTGTIEGADKLRGGWNSLSPVMRRRFLAGDRTDLAEERTALACYRTAMARARTGLAFTRTGIAFLGIGIALVRQFRLGPWTVFDAALVLTGIAMSMEGIYWYLPGRRAGTEGFKSVKRAENNNSIWDIVFPPGLKQPGSDQACIFSIKGSHAPGIWATTGLALERTLLGERRNVMARLRTVMARSRTGMAFIRTGMAISAVGMGLLVYFGGVNFAWMLFNVVLILTGVVFIYDGLHWHFPAEKIKKQFPYCFGEMEIIFPRYGSPSRYWRKAVFSHDDL